MKENKKIIEQVSVVKRTEMTRGTYEHFRKMVFSGDAIRIKNGLYCNIDDAFMINYEIEKIVPGGIMCMWSAWHYYDLCDTIPYATCVAVDTHRKVSVPEYPKFNLYYWNEKSLNTGVTTVVENNVEFRIYDIERCVCDALRFRNKIGMDVTAEIINRYLASDSKNMNKLHEYARIFKVDKILKNIIQYR